MRWDDIIGGSIGLAFGAQQSLKLWRQRLQPLGILDVFFLNLALCIVCYFLNPDINTFNVYFFNGHDPVTSYRQAIVRSSEYFSESPLLFFLYGVSLVLALTSFGWYMVLTRKTSVQTPSPLSG